MKFWKQLICVLMALTMLAAMAACTPADNKQTDPSETQGQTEAPETTAAPETTEATVPETTEDMSIYSAFIGTWYEGGSDVAFRLIIADDKTWRYEDSAGELMMNGYYSLLEEKVLELYNNDVELVTAVRLEDAENIYLEPMMDLAFELIQNTDFSKSVTNSDSMDVEEIVDDMNGSDVIIDDGAEDAPAE